MAQIPHADGPFAENTTYGLKKATALEALRRYLLASDFGWITAVTKCSVSIVNSKEICLIQAIATKSGPVAQVVLTSRPRERGFPISSAEVFLHIGAPVHIGRGDVRGDARFEIDEKGEMFQV